MSVRDGRLSFDPPDPRPFFDAFFTIKSDDVGFPANCSSDEFGDRRLDSAGPPLKDLRRTLATRLAGINIPAEDISAA